METLLFEFLEVPLFNFLTYGWAVLRVRSAGKVGFAIHYKILQWQNSLMLFNQVAGCSQPRKMQSILQSCRNII